MSSIGLLGKKIGMTSVYDAEGRLRPVTVIAAGDNTLLRRLTSENDGYSAIQVGFDTQKESRVTKALLGGFKKANSEPKKIVREFRLKQDAPEGEMFVPKRGDGGDNSTPEPKFIGDGPRPVQDILAKYNPGVEGQSFTVGNAAKFIAAGSDIVFEIHYATTGDRKSVV